MHEDRPSDGATGGVGAAAPFDAVVLAGGRARRLGGASKPDVLLAGRRLIDRTLDATAGARAVVVVGPAEVAPPGVRVAREEPPGGGPVAGLAAGLAALPGGAPLVLVLACDLPRVAGAARALVAAALVAAAPGGAVPGGGPASGGAVTGGPAPAGERHDEPHGALLVDADGRRQLLAAVYRRDALERAVARLAAGGGLVGASMRSLVAGLRLVEVPDTGGHGVDVDTWADVETWNEPAAWHDGERRGQGHAQGGSS